MTNFIFANNINTTLASAVSNSATTITLASTANLPATIPAGYVLAITLNDVATRQNFEVVYATARTGATLTVERAQEGTAALSWLTGDYVFSGPTAGQMGSFAEVSQLASLVGTFSGLRASANSGDTSVTFTANNIIVGTSIGGNYYQLNNFSQTFTPGATPGAGAMDTGSATANSWVAVYAGLNPSTGATTIFGTLEGSSVAPVTYGGSHPISGYTATCLLAIVPIGSTANQFASFNIINRLGQPVSLQILSGTTSATSQPAFSTLVTNGIPKTAIALLCGVSLTNTQASNSQFSFGPSANGAGAQQVSANTSSFGGNSQTEKIGIVTPQTIYYAAWGSNASNVLTYTMVTNGWEI